MKQIPAAVLATPAAWIWTADDPDVGGQLARFRLSFAGPGPACWFGFADTAYTLFCNGHELGIGPATGIHTRPRLTAWDLTPHLSQGTNVLALEVWCDGRKEGVPDTDVWQAGVLGWLQFLARYRPHI